MYCRPELAAKLQRDAAAAHRSVNGEMVARLEASYAFGAAAEKAVAFASRVPEPEAA